MSSPYYQDEHVTLYVGDSRLELAWLEADVLVTDPPYGSDPDGVGYGRGTFQIANDATTECRDEVLGLWGARPAIVFASPRLGPPPMAWEHRYVWDKRAPGMGGKIRYRHEDIYTTADIGKVGDGWSIIECHNSRNNFGHGHHKPQGLMAALVAACPDGVIADPFAGSGSTLVAAKQMGRQAIGVELEPRYADIIVDRLAQGVLL